MNTHQIYRFRHSILPIEVECTEHDLIYRANIKQKQIAISSIEAFFVHQPTDTHQHELILAYRNQPNASLQRMRIYADEHQVGFDDLMIEMRARLGTKELTDLSPQEAYEKMGSKNISQGVLIGFMGLAVIGIACMLLPILIHGLENEKALSTLAQSIQIIEQNQSFSSSYLSLEQAKALTDYQVILEGEKLSINQSEHTQKLKQQAKQQVLISLPLVKEDWQEGQEIHWIAQGLVNLDEIETLSTQRQWTGIVRDLLWEGVGDQEKQAFTKQNLRLSPLVKRLDFNASPQEELKIYGMMLGAFLFLFACVWLYLIMKKNEQPAPKTPIQKPKPLTTLITEDDETDD
jgi:hypothetical protein